MVRISSFSTIRFRSAFATLSGLPFSFKTAWKSEKRPWPALPPAESPSTMNSSERAGSEELQRKNFLESEVSISSPFFLLPARASSSTNWASLRAFCIWRIFLSQSLPELVLRSNHSFNPSSTIERTMPSTGALFKRSLVWPWNCGLTSFTEITTFSPCWMTSGLNPSFSRLLITPHLSA